MDFWIPFGIVCFLAFLLICDLDIDRFKGILLIMFITALLVFVARGYVVKGDGEPQAIDVYRGNTTLQITYQDSIPTDTIVVFRK